MDLIFSDIHADINALNKIIDLTTSSHFKKKYGEFSRVINLGDVLERGDKPKQVLQKMTELSKNYSFKSVMGNHDEAFLYGRKVSGSSFESLYAHESLTEKDLEFFKKNKDNTYGTQEFLDKKNSLVCVHGGPLNPKKITPKDAGKESWLYEKCWQRLSEYEEFSPYGYNYKASSAFSEAKTKIENSIILCGHQHEEAVITQNHKGIEDILSKTKPKREKLGDFTVEKKEFRIKQEQSYLVRLGLGGPQGYYGIGEANPHFGIIQHDSKRIILFAINSKQ